MTGSATPSQTVASSQSTMPARMYALLGDKRRLVAALITSSILSGFAEAGTLAILAQVAASLVSGAHRVRTHIGPVHLNATIKTLILVALALTVIRLLLQVPISALPARIAADVQAGLRRRLFHAFTRASWGVQSLDREGHLQEVMTSQVIMATQGALQTSSLITSLFTFLVLMVSALALNPAAAGVVLVMAVLLFVALRPLNRLGVRRARALSQAQLEYAGGISEASRVAEETRVFGVEPAMRNRIDGFIGISQDLFYRTQLIGRLVPGIYQSAIYLMLVGGLAVLYAIGRSHVASLGAVVLLLVRAGTNGQQVQGAYQALRQSLPFIERLQEAERRYLASTPSKGSRVLPRVQTLAFENVSFAYRPGRRVLSDVSFEVAGGEAVGIIGPSGAGKSTLVQIMLQLRQPVEGRYLVNGAPVEQFAPTDWHGRVSYVPQEPRLVHASVAENIRYFRNLDNEAVERAARLARIHDDIVSWAEGYDTIVGPRADAVSGGQQQRICLARALVARPEILVLDEPTSALDPHSEALIQQSLTALRSELMLFIIAHRMSTLDICDRVMVVMDGRLAAFDTIARLQADNAYYRSAAGIPVDASTGSVVKGNVVDPGVGVAESVVKGHVVDTGVGVQVNGTSNGTISPGVRSSRGRVPEFFIAGHPKSGTTALYEMLRRHPEIYMCEEKEPWFFSNELRFRAPPRKPFAIPDTLEDYLSLFQTAGPHQRVGEASTTYLWSPTAATAIAEVQPAARVIAILREPASFLHSLHLQFVEAHIETEHDFRTALSLEQARREGKEISRHSYWPQMLTYTDHVRYVEQLRRFHAVFPPEQVLVLIYDDFRRDNETTVGNVLRFLGVKERSSLVLSEANPTVRARSRRLHELVHAVSVGHGPGSRAVKASVQALTPQGLRRNALHAVQRRVVYGEPRPPEEALMLELRRRFKGEVVALSEYLGRDLVALWGYDGIE